MIKNVIILVEAQGEKAQGEREKVKSKKSFVFRPFQQRSVQPLNFKPDS